MPRPSPLSPEVLALMRQAHDVLGWILATHDALAARPQPRPVPMLVAPLPPPSAPPPVQPLPKDPMRLISYPELQAKKGIRGTRQYIAKLVKAGKFPAPIKRSAGAQCYADWIEAEIDAYIVSLRRQRDEREARSSG